MADYIGNERLSLYPQFLTPELERRAAEELYEDKETREMGVELLRKLISEAEGLPVSFDDEYLLMMLRARKYDINRALTVSENCFRFTREVLAIRNVTSAESLPILFSCFEEMARSGLMDCLPQRDDDGSVVFIYRICHWDVDKYTLDDHLFGVLIAMFAFQKFEANQITGGKVIFDYRGLSLKHAKYIGLHVNFFRHLSCALQNSLPGRLREIHLISGSHFFHVVVAIVKLVAPRKIRGRIHIHDSDPKTLFKFISPTLLSGNALKYGAITTHAEKVIQASKPSVTEIIRYILESRPTKKK